MITVTKKFSFCYGHYLFGYSGKCKNIHGHNSEVEVEFTHNIDLPPAYTDMIIDFVDIKKHIEPILERFDHKLLNDQKDIFGDDEAPTAENIVSKISKMIQETPIGPGLIRVRISETPTSWAEWRKD